MEEPKRTTKKKHKVSDWRPAFLAALRRAGTVRESYEAAGVCKTTAFDARKADPEFAQAWDAAIEEGTQHLERLAIQRAIGFRRRVVLHQGKPVFVWRDSDGEIVPDPDPQAIPAGCTQTVLYEDEHSDTLLIFTLKARRPEIYRERISHSGEADQPPIQIQSEVTGKLDIYARLAQLTEQFTLRVVDTTEESNPPGNRAGELTNTGVSPGGVNPSAGTVPV